MWRRDSSGIRSFPNGTFLSNRYHPDGHFWKWPNVLDFMYYWNVNFRNLIPLPDEFKLLLKHRWLRIHTFGVYQRYPRTEGDIAQLLERQNTVITDLCKSGTTFLVLVSGGDKEGDISSFSDFENVVDLSKFKFISNFPLHHLRPDEYEGAVDETHFTYWAFEELSWEWGILDNLLIEVSHDRLHYCFLLNTDNNCLIYPYDGGMDIIFPDTNFKNDYIIKYSSWISKLPTGL